MRIQYVERVSHRAQQSFHKILFIVSSSAESWRATERNDLLLLLLMVFPCKYLLKMSPPGRIFIGLVKAKGAKKKKKAHCIIYGEDSIFVNYVVA